MENIENYYNFELTDEQKELVEQLLDFFRSDDSVFIVKGYAGTGKTSVMLGLVKYLGKNNKPFMLMASTGRAAKVLAQKAMYPASTIHAAIYVLHIVEVKDSDNEISYRISFKQKIPNPVQETIYFVDESSMISNRIQSGGSIVYGTGYLLNDFFTYTGNGKVVFIGDPAQLPPVNARFSPALDKWYLRDTVGHGVRVFTLKKIMRYEENSGIFYNTERLRQSIESKRYPPLSIKAHDFDDFTVYYHENDLIKSYYEKIKSVGIDSCIFITYTNKTAAFVNRKVRHHLWGNRSDRLQPGESLIVARNNYLYNLNNGDLITIDSFEDSVIRKANLTFQWITVRVQDEDPAKGVMLKRVLIIKDLLDTDSRDLSLEQDMELLKNYFGRMSRIAKELYNIIIENQNSSPAYFEEIIGNKALEFGVTLNVSAIRENIPSKRAFIKKIARDNMQSDPYLNALRVKYGYAVTCHKAQGSEWPEVFIFLERALSYFDKEGLYRWTYTALSRAEKRIHILNNRYIY